MLYQWAVNLRTYYCTIASYRCKEHRDVSFCRGELGVILCPQLSSLT